MSGLSQGGPSSEHTAALLDEAASALEIALSRHPPVGGGEPSVWLVRSYLRDGTPVLRLPLLPSREDFERYAERNPDVELVALYEEPTLPPPPAEGEFDIERFLQDDSKLPSRVAASPVITEEQVERGLNASPFARQSVKVRHFIGGDREQKRSVVRAVITAALSPSGESGV